MFFKASCQIFSFLSLYTLHIPLLSSFLRSSHFFTFLQNFSLSPLYHIFIALSSLPSSSLLSLNHLFFPNHCLALAAGRRRRMGRRARVAAAAVTLTVACCVASVMGRVLLPAPAARTPRNPHSWLTNNLGEQQQEEEEEDEGEVLLVRERYQTDALESLSQQQRQRNSQEVLRRGHQQIHPPSSRGEQQEEQRSREGGGRGGYQTATALSSQEQQQGADNNNLDYLFKSGELLVYLLPTPHPCPEVTRMDGCGTNQPQLFCKLTSPPDLDHHTRRHVTPLLRP